MEGMVLVMEGVGDGYGRGGCWLWRGWCWLW